MLLGAEELLAYLQEGWGVLYLYFCLMPLLHPRPPSKAFSQYGDYPGGTRRQERNSLKVLSQGNEKDNLQTCRGSVLGQECANIHRTGPLSTPTSGEEPAAVPEGSQGITMCTQHWWQGDGPAPSTAGHAGAVSGLGWECISTQDTHFCACELMESCTMLPAAPEGATALLCSTNLLSCST